jgi:hypothetical protein
MRIGVIAEGHGDVSALPVLLRRIAHDLNHFDIEVTRPIRIRRSRIARRFGEYERAVKLAVADACDVIVAVVDADDDCPAELAPELVRRAAKHSVEKSVSVVLANREYESWFLAAIESLRGRRGIRDSATIPKRVEEIRGAKERLQELMEEGYYYSETVDQPALSALFSLDEARTNSASFDKLWRDIEHILR